MIIQGYLQCYFKTPESKRVSNHVASECKAASDAISKHPLFCINPTTVHWFCHTYSSSLFVSMLFLATMLFHPPPSVSGPYWAFLVRLGCAGGCALFGEFLRGSELTTLKTQQTVRDIKHEKKATLCLTDRISKSTLYFIVISSIAAVKD